MARVPQQDPASFPEVIRRRLAPETLDDRAALASLRAWAVRPELAVALLDLRARVASASTLSDRLLELVRLRIAFHNQCRSCMSRRDGAAQAQGLGEELVCELRHPDESDLITAAEQAALRYADCVATAPLEIDDALFAHLHEHFTDGEIVELGMHVAICLGFGRVAASWDLVDELPSGMTRDGVVGPWDLEPADVNDPHDITSRLADRS